MTEEMLKKRIDFEKKWLKDLIFESGITMGDIDIAFSSINHHINDYVKEVKECAEWIN